MDLPSDQERLAEIHERAWKLMDERKIREFRSDVSGRREQTELWVTDVNGNETLFASWEYVPEYEYCGYEGPAYRVPTGQPGEWSRCVGHRLVVTKRPPDNFEVRPREHDPFDLKWNEFEYRRKGLLGF